MNRMKTGISAAGAVLLVGVGTALGVGLSGGGADNDGGTVNIQPVGGDQSQTPTPTAAPEQTTEAPVTRTTPPAAAPKTTEPAAQPGHEVITPSAVPFTPNPDEPGVIRAPVPSPPQPDVHPLPTP